MSRLARLAIGTVQPGVDAALLVWAVLAALESRSLRVQHFASQACFAPHDGARAITGQTTRHLDTWLLEPEGCRRAFERGTVNADFALVEGRFDTAMSGADEMGGKLATLAEWLDLPSIAMVDACQIRDCSLPNRPASLDGVIIVGARCCSERCKLQTWLEALWKVPVLGFVEDCGWARAELTNLSMGDEPPRELVQELARQAFSPELVQRLLSIAHSHADLPGCPAEWYEPPEGKSPVVAIAYDDAFHCYYPDALEQLELCGATIADFSPLRDDRLPPGTDLVYFGCGRPELYSSQLRNNCCLIAALGQHIESGGRIYAECGGLAYLGQHIELPDGQHVPMSGLLPLTTSILGTLRAPAAVELSLESNCWLGDSGQMLRGYRTGRWLTHPALRQMQNLAADDGDEFDLVAYRNAIGSRVHLHFTSQPLVLDRLLRAVPA
jgi:cobyrinic acid a,c-diamide synthase